MKNSEFEKEGRSDYGSSDVVNLIPLPSADSKFCEAYKARLYGKWIFLKTVRESYMGDARVLDSLRKEMEVGFQLDHPNLPRYVMVRELLKGRPSVAMELIEGTTLQEFVTANPDYFSHSDNVEKFIRELASALDYLHSRQILHLDIKPNNVMITTTGRNAKLIDLGCCATDAFRDTAGLTPGFHSPERITDRVKSTAEDFYGLGRLLQFIRENSNDFPTGRFKRLEAKLLAEDPTKRLRSGEAIERELSAKKRPYAAVGAGIIVLLLAALLLIVIPEKKTEGNSAVETVAEEMMTENRVESEVEEEPEQPKTEPAVDIMPRQELGNAVKEKEIAPIKKVGPEPAEPKKVEPQTVDPDPVQVDKLTKEIRQHVLSVYGELGEKIRKAAKEEDYSEETYQQIHEAIRVSFQQLMAMKDYMKKYPKLSDDLIQTIIIREMEKEDLNLWSNDWTAYEKKYANLHR